MQTKRPTLAVTSLAGAVLLATLLGGCGNVPGKQAAGEAAHQPSAATSVKQTTEPSAPQSDSSTPAAPADPGAVSLVPSVQDDADDVAVDTVVSVKADAGTVSTVKLWTRGKDDGGDTKKLVVDGSLSDDGTTWTADEALDPGSRYRLEMAGKNAAGEEKTSESSFTTENLSLNEQTYAQIQPKKGAKVGVGMPVILTFDLAVKDREEFQKHLSVTSSPSQEGTWSWLDSKTVHYRPKVYWKPGTKVSVKADLNGVKAGNGVYGQRSISTSFTVGRSLITNVDLKRHVATVVQDGRKVRSFPVTGGKPGWRTRSGVKLIMEKEYNKVMTSEAIGAPESYRLTAKYAMRVTNSGEFLHSAPWSMNNLGVRNASHGCVGMSIANSGWLYERVLPGDPVVTTGTNRDIEQGNGWSDWDISYAKYKARSAV